MATTRRKPNSVVSKTVVKSRGRGRAASTITTTGENEVEEVSTPVKKTPTKKTSVKNVSKPAPKKTTSKRGGFHREKDSVTGFVPGSDSHKVAEALLAGGASREEINSKLRKTLGAKTKNGTDKPITAITSGVLNKLISQGFTVESSFKVLPPTAASKRAATRRRNAAK